MSEELIYTSTEPDIGELSEAYENAILELDTYFDECATAYDDRRNIWPGKTSDLRKHGATAFPWDGASDQEVNVVGERLDTYVALCMQALHGSHIKAFATNPATMGRASVVSSFLKWMRTTYIPDFKGQMELSANHLFEKKMMVSYVGWKREKRTYLSTVTMEQIAQTSPEMVDMILSGSNDEEITATLIQTFDLSTPRAKRVIKDLREKGEADIPTPRYSVDCPIVQACAPDGEVIMPSWVTDPQRSPWIIWRTFMTPQEIEKKVTASGWDRDWADYAIQNLVGKDNDKIDGEKQKNQRRPIICDDDSLVMVLYAYQRLIDDEGAEGIYCTIFHPDAKDAGQGYAKHELANGHDDYPFVFTSISRDQKRLYEGSSMTMALRGPQMQIKTERDSRVDRASMATLPPLMHPAGRPPSEWGPGRKVPYRRLGEIAFGPTPSMDSGSIEVEQSMRLQADRAVGLDYEHPSASARQAFYIRKFLDHVKETLSMAFKLYQRMGPDNVFFSVTGIADPQTMTKGDPDENYSITVDFDNLMTDPETAESQIKQIANLVTMDRNGRIDTDKLLELAANAISPVVADYVLQPKEVAAEKMQKDVTDDLSKIFAGIEVPARPNGASYALQIVQAYASQPDVAQRLQNDEAFAERLQKYASQYAFVLEQQQNAQIGRIGTAPAQVGQVQTQGMEQ